MAPCSAALSSHRLLLQQDLLRIRSVDRFCRAYLIGAAFFIGSKAILLFFILSSFVGKSMTHTVRPLTSASLASFVSFLSPTKLPELLR